MSYTTPFKLTREIKKLHDAFDTLIAHRLRNNKEVSITLTKKQYLEYLCNLKDKNHTGDIYYKGILIRKAADAN